MFQVIGCVSLFYNPGSTLKLNLSSSDLFKSIVQFDYPHLLTPDISYPCQSKVIKHIYYTYHKVTVQYTATLLMWCKLQGSQRRYWCGFGFPETLCVDLTHWNTLPCQEYWSKNQYVMVLLEEFWSKTHYATNHFKVMDYRFETSSQDKWGNKWHSQKNKKYTVLLLSIWFWLYTVSSGSSGVLLRSSPLVSSTCVRLHWSVRVIGSHWKSTSNPLFQSLCR